MFNYFTSKTSDTNYTIKKYYKFEYIKRRYELEINKIKDYYSNRDRAVSNRHILSRLISILTPDYKNTDIRYFSIVDTNSKFISKQFDIVSNLHRGKVLKDNLYGANSSEVLLYVSNDIDFDMLPLMWKTESPLRCVHTNMNTINFSFPYENVTLPENSFSVFEIDINLMLMMYKYWCLERVEHDMSINPNVFVAKHVLPNTINSIMDLSLVNRFFTLSNGGKLATAIVNPHPFHILNYTEGIDVIFKDIVKDVRNEQITIEQLFKSIPSITYNDMSDVIKLNARYFNRQSKWVLWTSKITLSRQILYILGPKGRRRNKEYVNSVLPFMLKTIKNRDTEIESILTPVLYNKFNKELKSIIKIVKK